MSVPIFTKEEEYTLKEIKEIIEKTDDVELEAYMDCVFGYKGNKRE